MVTSIEKQLKETESKILEFKLNVKNFTDWREGQDIRGYVNISQGEEYDKLLEKRYCLLTQYMRLRNDKLRSMRGN